MNSKTPIAAANSHSPTIVDADAPEPASEMVDDAAPAGYLHQQMQLFEQVSELNAEDKIALIHYLLSTLSAKQIQTIVELGVREIKETQRRGAANQHNTRLLLKKDYSYQERGLGEPTQYYVYLRRRKPKLDRYIGALFYVPQGCTLAYHPDDSGRIMFDPPHNLFQLKDAQNPATYRVVRLLCLVPPPPDYTFTKQQNDTPNITLHLEELDPITHQRISQTAYPFPLCMHEGGKLDRYRWEVSPLPTMPAIAPPKSLPPRLPEPPSDLPPLPSGASEIAAKASRRVLELPANRPTVLSLSDPTQSEAVLKRMRLWVTWSEKAMPQSKWEMVQEEDRYTLRTVRFKRRILVFAAGPGTVILEHSLPVLVKWFHTLALAVSQTQNQRQYSAAQLKLAHGVFVEMSLPQTDPQAVLKQLLGVEFTIL